MVAVAIPAAGPVHLAAEEHDQEQQDQQVVVFRNGQVPYRRLKPPKQEIEQGYGGQQPDKALAEENLVGNDLQDFELAEQFEVADDQQQQADMKHDEKNPQNRFVPADRREEKGVVQRPEPGRFFCGEDLEGCRVFGGLEDFDQTHRRADDENGRSQIDHGHENDIGYGFHGCLPRMPRP